MGRGWAAGLRAPLPEAASVESEVAAACRASLLWAAWARAASTGPARPAAAAAAAAPVPVRSRLPSPPAALAASVLGVRGAERHPGPPGDVSSFRVQAGRPAPGSALEPGSREELGAGVTLWTSHSGSLCTSSRHPWTLCSIAHPMFYWQLTCQLVNVRQSKTRSLGLRPGARA